MVVAVTCSKCKKQVTGKDRPYAPMDVIMRHFAEAGWRIAAKGTTAMCPACQQENAAAPPPDAAAISAEFERQRVAEELRQAAAKPHVDVAKRILQIIEAMPRGARGRPDSIDWLADPEGVAEIVGYYGAMPRSGRSLFIRDHVGCSALRTAIYYFMRGLNAEGRKIWPELREVLTRRGIPWNDTPPSKFKKKKKTAKAKEETTQMKPTDATSTATSTIDAERARVQVVRLLDAHFTVTDGQTCGQYANGWSDERVAKESGLALDLVKRTRVSAYGDIIDPKAAKIEAAIAVLADEAKTARTMLAELDAKIAALSKQVADLKRR